MFSDVFSKKKALQLLKGKKIWLVGSSNMRAIYKDIIWLLNAGSLATDQCFKVKNEPSFFNDQRLSNDTLHNGRSYQESRVYNANGVCLRFHFITRLYLDHFLELIRSIDAENCPDVLLLNSCLWDLSRWGPEGVQNYKENLLKTLKFLKSTLPASVKVIWKTALPVSTTADGAIFVDGVKYIVPMLPWHILEANTYASNCANFFHYDTLDMHHHMRFLGHLRVKDGIHWQPLALRYLTNIFLTHVGLFWNQQLPGNFKPSIYYLNLTSKRMISAEKLDDRVNKKQHFFEKLFKKTQAKFNNKLGAIKNNVMSVGKALVKKKNKYKNKLKNFNNYRKTVANYDTQFNKYGEVVSNQLPDYTCNRYVQDVCKNFNTLYKTFYYQGWNCHYAHRQQF